MIGRVVRKLKFLFVKLRIRSFESLLHSHLKNWDVNKLPSIKEELNPFYEFYINKISRADMAASLELSVFMYALLQQKRMIKLLDLGSGFSSFVLRRLAKDQERIVFSVDDNIQWLKTTIEYLESYSLSVENVIPLQEFVESNSNDFDFILLDLNYVEVRKDYVKLSIDRCAAGGFILIDDVHKREFMTEVLQQTKFLPVKLYSLEKMTKDNFVRYALLLVKE